MIEAHRGAFEYDWRARFPGLKRGVKAIGRSMSWGEAYRVTQQLATDPSSAVGASLAGWDYPASREALVLMDYYDAFAKLHFKRPQPYQRPWPDRTKQRPKPTVSQKQVIAALRMAGHTGPLPAWAADTETEVISHG